MTTVSDTGGSDRRTSKDTAKNEAKKVGKDIKSKADEVRDEASKTAHDAVGHAKETVADEITSVGEALRRAADELRDGSPQERSFGQMAGSLADLSDQVRDKDIGQMVHEMSEFARRNPVTFLGGAALLGFAGARFAKASRRNPTENDQRSEMSGVGADGGPVEGRQHYGTSPAQPQQTGGVK